MSRRSFVTDRPVAILMLFLAAVVFGYFSYQRLPLQLMPDLTYPTVTVRTEYPGAAPEEVENDISRPVEEALGVIGGLQRISSVSRVGVSDVVLEFTWDTDISDATQDILERLDLVFLPDEAERPLILHFDPSLDPVLELSLSGEGVAYQGEEGLRRLRRIAELQVKRQIEPIKGVAAARIKGGLEEEIHILVREEQLRRTGISIQQVIDRLAAENINVAGGTIQEGRTEYLVRTLNEYENLEQMRETIVTVIDDRPVRIRDLAEVRRSHKERQIVTHTDGVPSVQIEVFKEADANIVALAARVHERVGEIDEEPAEARPGRGRRGMQSAGGGLAQQLYENEQARLKVTADRSVFIESSVNEVRNTAIMGGLLAVIVLFLFLREVRTTVIIALSIPISLLMAFAPLNLWGVSLNIMTLGGLALGIGMLVDSSIVVLESIHRCREEGDGLVNAAIRGTQEVRAAVMASTMTTIAVFFPMVFVEGVAGQAFGDLGIAVVVSLLASMVVAIFFIPMLASRGARANAVDAGGGRRRWLHFASITTTVRSLRQGGRWNLTLVRPVYVVLRGLIAFVLELVGKVALLLMAVLLLLAMRVVRPVFEFLLRHVVVWPLRAVESGLAVLQNGYPRVLRWALRHPWEVSGLVIVSVALTALGFLSLESELLPQVHQGEFTFELALPVGTPIERTEEVLDDIERALLEEGAGIETLLVTYGFDPAESQRSDEGEHTARFKVLVEAEGRTPEREEELLARLRQRFEGIPDLEVNVTRPVLFSSKTPIEVEVHGDDLQELRAMSERVQSAMLEIDELADVQATLRAGAPEVQVVYDREKLMRYELDLGAVARRVRDRVQGYEATRLNRVDRRIPMVVQLTEEDRRSVEDVEQMVVNPGEDRPIRLASVADVRLGEGPSEVRRVDGRRVALLRANLGEGSLGAAVQAIEGRLQRLDWPADMTFFISGQNEEWERSRGSLYLALALSVFLVYVIMAVQFESLVHPLVIMFTIPLAFVGTVVSLKLLSIPLSVVVFLGMIMLAGIVVNNAIVLVDYVNQLRRRGLEREEALVTAGRVRLRPILMTTATTVLGLTPMALGMGDGAEIRTPMAISVITGLISSTVLTLLVLPTIYAVIDGLVGGSLGEESEDRSASDPAGSALDSPSGG